MQDPFCGLVPCCSPWQRAQPTKSSPAAAAAAPVERRREASSSSSDSSLFFHLFSLGREKERTQERLSLLRVHRSRHVRKDGKRLFHPHGERRRNRRRRLTGGRRRRVTRLQSTFSRFSPASFLFPLHDKERCRGKEATTTKAQTEDFHFPRCKMLKSGFCPHIKSTFSKGENDAE